MGAEVVWQFLDGYLRQRGRSLRSVARNLGFGELELVWLNGSVTPELGEKEQRALGEATTLPATFWKFLVENVNTLEITLQETHMLAATTDRRHGAMLSPTDYRAILDELRYHSQAPSLIQVPNLVRMVDCSWCGTPFPGGGRCPDCGRQRNA